MDGTENRIRHFGGKLFVRKAGKEWTDEERLERNVERKHLKAYLRGDRQYHHSSFGIDKMGFPFYKQVNAIWI